MVVDPAFPSSVAFGQRGVVLAWWRCVDRIKLAAVLDQVLDCVRLMELERVVRLVADVYTDHVEAGPRVPRACTSSTAIQVQKPQRTPRAFRYFVMASTVGTLLASRTAPSDASATRSWLEGNCEDHNASVNASWSSGDSRLMACSTIGRLSSGSARIFLSSLTRPRFR